VQPAAAGGSGHMPHSIGRLQLAHVDGGGPEAPIGRRHGLAANSETGMTWRQAQHALALEAMTQSSLRPHSSV
jgi:hypothetical protein